MKPMTKEELEIYTREQLAATEAFFAEIKARPGYAERAAAFREEYATAVAIEKARRQAKLTQTEVAQKMGTTQSVISRIERGANVSINKLRDYAHACDTELVITFRKRRPAGQ